MRASGDGIIFVLNAGSSSLKLALFSVPDLSQLGQGVVRRVGSDNAVLHLAWAGQTRDGTTPAADHASALDAALVELDRLQPGWRSSVVAVGHRVVHGGSRYTAPIVISAQVEQDLQALVELAPLHNGRAIEVLRRVQAALPVTPQVACFDTMFHSTLPSVAWRYALPRDLADRFNIRRYGFHGLSCAGAVHVLGTLGISLSRVVICHLGAGASITAVRDGRSLDTTMGFTPLEGLVMATRSGSIDPSIPLFLQRHAGMSPEEVEYLLESQSGLLGLSGASGDVAVLEERAGSGDHWADAALEAFAYRVRLAIGAFWALLGGLDVLVLTGGIGEHSSGMRRRILEPLAALGIQLDPAANSRLDATTSAPISPQGALPAVWMIPAREEETVARLTIQCLGLLLD